MDLLHIVLNIILQEKVNMATNFNKINPISPCLLLLLSVCEVTSLPVSLLLAALLLHNRQLRILISPVRQSESK